MDVFDSSVWLLALVTDLQRPTQLYNDVVDGNRRVAIDAYIHSEVETNIERADISRKQKADAQMLFNDVVARQENVVFPSQDDISAISVESERLNPSNRLLSAITNLEAKDVPILVFAYSWTFGAQPEPTTIYTFDSGFGNLSPAAHGIDSVTIEQVRV